MGIKIYPIDNFLNLTHKMNIN